MTEYNRSGRFPFAAIAGVTVAVAHTSPVLHPGMRVMSDPISWQDPRCPQSDWARDHAHMPNLLFVTRFVPT